MVTTLSNAVIRRNKMIITEVEKILQEAEALAYRIAEGKSIECPYPSPGNVFNHTHPEINSIWKDVCIAYNHFKAIDLNILVEAYNKYITTPVKYYVHKVGGCRHTAFVCNDCPSSLGICAMLPSFEKAPDTKMCPHNKGLDSNYVMCGYKKELEK
jgi:hypothetical protein